MKKLLLIFLFIIYSVTIHSQTYQPLNIDGFNADVIANGTGTAESSTTNDLDVGGYCLKSIDWKLTTTSTPQTTGFPLNGIVASIVSLTPGLTYQLQNYSNNNSIRIAYGGSSITSLVTGIVKAKKLFVLATTGSNNSNMQCTITFADNTTQEFLTNNVPDWFNGATPPPAFIGFGRLMRSSNIFENPYNNPRLYQIELNIATANQNKEIQSITFGRTDSTIGVLNIFAVSAELVNSTNLCNAPSLISATPGSICGYGTAELKANYNTGTVRWFANATGGNALHTGTTFTTPIIDATTSYWVSSTGVTQTIGTVGPTSPTTQGGNIDTQNISWDVEFSVLNETVLNSIDIFPMASGENGNIQVRTISGTLIQTYPFTTNVSGGTVAQTILLNHAFIPGEYELDVSLPNSGISRNESGANYPYTSPSINILRNGYDQTYYMGFYNWKYTDECTSARTEIIATVTPAPPLTLTNTNVVLCAGQSQTVAIASGTSNYDSYTITPTTGVTGDATTGWVFNPTVNTVYTLSAKQTTGALCKKDILIDVRVNTVPVINTNVNTVNTCVNEITSITSTISGLNKNVTFGEGTTVTAIIELPNPLTAWYGGNKTQMLYLATELTAKGFFAGSRIQSLAFDVVTFNVNVICNDFRIKIGNTNLSVLTNSLQNSANLQTVYNQTFAPTQTGWVTFNFATPFIWDGVSNIIIETAHNSGNNGNGAGTTIRYSETPFASCSYGLSDLVIPAGVSSFDALSSFNRNSYSRNRPNVILGTGETLTSIWSPVDHLYTDALATVPYVAGTSAENVYLKANVPVNSQDYTLTTTSQNNCSASKIINVTVHETPAPIITETNYCITNTLADVEATFTPMGIVKWYDAVSAGTELPLTTALVNGTSYFASQTVSNCESERTEVIVTIHNTPAPAAVDQEFCIAENATVADLVATGTNLKWYASATSTSELNTNVSLVNGTSYFASQTLNNCESTTRTEVVVTIHNTPAPAAVDQTFCIADNATIADLVATGTDIKWYASITSTTALNANVSLVNGTSYFATQTLNNCENAIRKEVIVTIHNTPAPAAINQTFCIAENATIADLVATGTNLKWYASATSTTSLNANVALVNGTSYFASQTVSNCESERTEVIVTIHNTPAPTAIDQDFCIAENATIASLVATGTDIKWYDSITSTTALNANVVLVNGTSYFASQTVSNCESERTEVIVTIHNTPVPTAVDQEFCSNTNSKIADLVVTGTDIKWYASATSTIELNLNVALVNGTSYFASQTLNNCESVDRAEVVVTIHNTPAPTAVNQTFCIAENATIADLVATGTNLKWYASATSTTALNTNVTLVNGTSYFASQTVNNCESVDRTEVVVTIHNTPVPTAVDQDFCIAENATIADLVATGQNIKWYDSITSTTALNTNVALVNGTSYFASQTVNNCESVDRAEVVVSIHNTPVPTAVDQDFCIAENATIADLVAIGQNIKWYDSITSTTALNAYVALVNGTSYFASQTVSNCESERTEVIVTIHNTPAPTAINQTFCIAENATIVDLVATGQNVKWYDSITSTTALNTNVALVNGTSYFASQTVSNCESERTEVIVTIHNTPAPTAINQTFCIAENATIADLVATGTNIKWYETATSTTALNANVALVNGTSYFTSQTVSNCESERTEVIITIHNTPAPTAVDQTFCIAENATIADLVATGQNIKWYDSVNSTTALNTNVALVNGTSYFASQTLNNCESVDRAEVIIIIHNTPAPTAINQTFCIAENATIGDLVATGQNVKWYETATSTTELNANLALVNGTSYFATQTLNNCESAIRKEVIVTIHNTPAPTALANQEFCSNTNSKIADLVVTGTDIKWYASATSTIELNLNVALVNGASYFASQTVNDCESINRVQVQVQISTPPNLPNGDSIQTFCGNATIADLEIVGLPGAELIWYPTSYSNTILATSTALANATYYVAQKIGACISDRKPVTARIINLSPPNVSDFEFCGSATVADLYIPTPTGVTYKWYNSPSNPNELQPYIALTTGTYFVSKNEYNCETQRTAVSVVIKDLPDSPTGVSPQTFIEGSIINQIVVNPTTAVYYITEEDARTSTNPLSPNMPLVNGTTYYAVVIGTNGCPSLPLPITVDVYLSNNEFEKDKLKYYPNPVNDKLHIEYFENIVQVDVYDLMGRKIKSISTNDRKVEIDLSELSTANYMIQLQTESKQQFIKIIKQ